MILIAYECVYFMYTNVSLFSHGWLIRSCRYEHDYICDRICEKGVFHTHPVFDFERP